MGIEDVEKYLKDNHFSKKTYKELSTNSKAHKESLIMSNELAAYDFDEITKFIFPKNPPRSADAILFKEKKITFVEFKGGFKRKISEQTFDPEKCRCPKTNEVCEDYAKIMKSNLKNINRELKANLLQKAVESRWILEHHLLPEVYKDGVYPEFRTDYIIVTDKVHDNPIDAMEEIMNETAQIHNKDNFYQKMNDSIKRLYCESRFGKKSTYNSVEVWSVQDFEQKIS